MDVLHLYDGHEKILGGRGSVPNVVWNLARETAAKGHNVTVIERQWNGLKKRAEHSGVEFRRIPLRTGASEPWIDVPYEMVSTVTGASKLLVDRANFAVQALRVLRDSAYDVVHAHLPFAANVLITFAPWVADRMVYTAHIGETETRVVEPRFSPDAYLADRTAKTIVLNPGMRTAFERRGVGDDSLTVIPNGVDVDRFRDPDESVREAVEREHGLEDTHVVLFVGTVTPRKGVTELLEAAGGLLENTDKDVTVVVVGKNDIEPEYTTKVRELVSENEIDDDVVFTGFVPDEQIPAFYDLASVFVLPSYEEGSSISVTEAIASQTPVVGSRIDGINQQIDDGVHGLLVAPGSTAELEDALETLIEDEPTRKRMSDALEERANELSWPRVTERILDVYGGIAW